MRTIKGACILLICVVMILAITQTAWAANMCEVSANDFFANLVNKNATGTKLSGTLTVYYQPILNSSCKGGVLKTEKAVCSNGDPKTDMNIFMRLRKGSTLYSFSGVIPNMCYFDVYAQANAVKNFIRTTVVGSLFPPGVKSDVMSVDQVVQDNEMEYPGCCGNMYFLVADIVVAVQD